MSYMIRVRMVKGPAKVVVNGVCHILGTDVAGQQVQAASPAWTWSQVMVGSPKSCRNINVAKHCPAGVYLGGRQKNYSDVGRRYRYRQVNAHDVSCKYGNQARDCSLRYRWRHWSG